MTRAMHPPPHRIRRLAALGFGLPLLLGGIGCELGTGTAPPPSGVEGFDLGGCTATAVIEDAEDNDHRVIAQDGRGGYMYTFLDDAGSTVEPVAGRLGGTFSQARGGANGSLYAAHITGQLATGSLVFAGYGVNLVDPKGPYDASAYQGVSFYARRGPDSPGTLRLKVPDTNTDPEGGVCSECFNDFGADIEVGEQWQQYVLPFEGLAQMSGWGTPRPGAIDSTAIYGVQFQINTPGAAFDLWVDDIAFYGCSQ